MNSYDYSGPSVFGYETDSMLRRAASVSVHTSPLATLGGSDAGGMNVYVRELSCHLSQLGLPIDIFTRRTNLDSPDVIPLCPGVNVVTITAGPPEPVDKNSLFQYLPEFAAATALYSLRHGLRYDVVHSHYWLSGWVAHLLKRYWNTPFVQMFHTTAHMKNAVAEFADRETALRLKIERQLVSLADSLIAANPDERADLIWCQGSPAEKICTVPPGVDLELFMPRDRAACRRELDLAESDRVVLFVGRIDPIKGIDTLIEATTRLSAGAAPPIMLVVGGELDDAGEPIGSLARVAQSANDLGVRDRFRFVGSQPQNRLPVFYNAADVVAVPSRYESFGLVAVEAMACGTPVVASRAGGLAFTVDEGTAGYLVPPRDADALAAALDRILSNPDLRRDLGQGALECAQRFAWPSVASSIYHVYERLASGQRADLCCNEEIFA